MYTGRQSRDTITPEWAEKTPEFMEPAFRRVRPDHAATPSGGPSYDMLMHLCKNGFRQRYAVWVYHGESHSRLPAKPSDDLPQQNGDLVEKKDGAVRW